MHDIVSQFVTRMYYASHVLAFNLGLNYSSNFINFVKELKVISIHIFM